MKYFTADTHLNHNKIFAVHPGADPLTYRHLVFDSIEQHDAAIIAAINARVTKQDELFILGDFTFDRLSSGLAKWRSKIKSKGIWLIRGNHDPSPTACRRAFGLRYRDTHETKVCGIPTWLSHYAHLVWPKSHYGSFHLYGHTHEQKEDVFDALMPERRSMDVGVDNAYTLFGEYRPFSESEVYEILKERKGFEVIVSKYPKE